MEMCGVCRGCRRSVVLGPLFVYVLLCLSIGLSVGQETPSSSNTTAPSHGQPSGIALAKQARQLAAAGRIEDALVTAQAALARGEQEYGPQHEFVGFILDDLATLHFRLNRLDTALRYAERAVAVVSKRLGTDASPYAVLANNLATIHFSLGRFHQAEPLYRQAHATFRARVGLRHARTARAARNLGLIYTEMSRLTQAQAFFEEALATNRELDGEESAAVARGYLDVAGISLRNEDEEHAQRAADKARQIFARHRPVNLPDLVASEVMLARIAIQQSRLRQAEDTLHKGLKRLEAAGMQQSLTTASVLNYLGFLHILTGQSVEAEPVYQRVLAIYRDVVGEQHPAVARTLHGLAIANQDLGQYDEAERLYQRAIDIFTASLGAIDASVAATRLELALFLSERRRATDAIREARAALSIYKQLPDARDIERAYAMSALGFALHGAGQLEAAAQSFERATDLMAEVRGETSLDLPPGLTALGEIYLQQGRFAAAEHSLERAIRIQEHHKAATPRHLAKSLDLRARLHRAQQRLDEALTMSRRATGILSERAATTATLLSASGLREQQRARDVYTNHIDLLYALSQQRPDHSFVGEAFMLAQRAQVSSASQAVVRMAARFAAAGDALAKVVRERQDLVERWQYLDGQLTKALSTASGTPHITRERLKERQWQAERAQTEAHIRGLDRTLRFDFPRYAQLTNPEPLTVGEVRQLLRANEALLVQTTTEDATFLWLVRPRAPVAFVRAELGRERLEHLVRSIRHSVEGEEPPSLADLAAFDVASAYDLYRRLLAPLEQPLTRVAHLIFVPDGALQSLPLALLITQPAPPPTGLQDYPALAWLGRNLAISTLPAVTSLRALWVFARPSTAWQPFLGIGDPDLQGPATGTRGVSRPAPDGSNVQTAGLGPLPETVYELRDIARTLDGDSRHLLFRERATESAVKHHPELSSFRVVAFGTHGLMAGEFLGKAEPALVLTPPERAEAMDDGLLTASEIARLELNAEWVILSACNTAGFDGTPGAPGLSGLVQSFFYAGTRALLVSHWSVASDAAGLITTGTLERLAAEPGLGRAEALRRAMRPLMDGERAPYLAHPRFWAPFVVIGEGSSGMQAAWQRP